MLPAKTKTKYLRVEVFVGNLNTSIGSTSNTRPTVGDISGCCNSCDIVYSITDSTGIKPITTSPMTKLTPNHFEYVISDEIIQGIQYAFAYTRLDSSLYSTSADTFVDTDLPTPDIQDPLTELVQQLAPSNLFPSADIDNINRNERNGGTLYSSVHRPPSTMQPINISDINNISSQSSINNTINNDNTASSRQASSLRAQPIPNIPSTLPFTALPLHSDGTNQLSSTMPKSAINIDIQPISSTSINATVKIEPYNAEWCDFLYRMVDQSVSQNMFQNLQILPTD